jgi:hypothetical protein
MIDTFLSLNTRLLGLGRSAAVAAGRSPGGSMVFKLRKVVYSITFWVAIFAAIVVSNTVWAITH